MAHYVIFSYLPMYGIAAAFKDFQIGKEILRSPWAYPWYKHFGTFVSSVYFGRLIRNTILINVYFLLFGFPAPILFALAINEVGAGAFKRIVQTVSYFPYFISTVVVVSMIYTFLSPVDGLVSKVVALLGGTPQNYLGDPRLFRPIYVASGIWQGFGWSSILYLAAMAAIDPELYEAAAIDGVSRFKRMVYITVPCIAPTIVLLLILNIGSLLSGGAEKIILMYNPLTYETADVISSYIFRRRTMDMEVSLSTAVGLFNSLINFVLLVTANQVSRRLRGASLW